MIALARTVDGDKIDDPEEAAQEGWRRFWPHWADCSEPGVPRKVRRERGKGQTASHARCSPGHVRWYL